MYLGKPRVIQSITRIYRLPGNQTAKPLTCHHRRSVTRTELDREQLFSGKAMAAGSAGGRTQE
jgi:hypothetical protein